MSKRPEPRLESNSDRPPAVLIGVPDEPMISQDVEAGLFTSWISSDLMTTDDWDAAIQLAVHLVESAQARLEWLEKLRATQ